MVFAVAALLFQFMPGIQTFPAPGSGSAASATSLPVSYALNAPDASGEIATATGRSVPSTGASSNPASGASTFSPVSVHSASLDAWPQSSQSLSTIRILDSDGGRPDGVILAEKVPSRRSWIALSLLQHGSAAFDAYSTRYSIVRGAVENDPFMRPFANSSAIYAAIQVCPVILDFAARKMQHSQNGFMRHSWWIPQSVSTGMFLASGAHNLHIANRR